MKATKTTMKLISAVEYEIGSSCYNASSYNGWTGDTGCSFRYPLVYQYKDKNGEVYEDRCRLKIDEYFGYINPDNIRSAAYKFGANELCIGAAIIDMLTMLEDRYGLDFEKLEKAYQKEKKNREE